MKKVLLFVAVSMLCVIAKAQLLTWSPQFPADNSTITITVDATKGNQGLKDFAGPVYMHLGVITNLSATPTSWRYVPTEWGTTTAPAATAAGVNRWTFVLNNPRAYFNSSAGGVPPGETILKVAILFRSADGSKVQKNTDGSDMYVPIYTSGSSQIIFTQPALVPNYSLTNEAVSLSVGQNLALTAVASTAAGTLNLYHNGVKIAGPVTGNNTITGSAAITATGNQQMIAELISAGNPQYDTLNYYIAPSNTILALPAGVQEGINYGPGCDSVTLVLYAPNKQNAVVLGDFEANNWAPKSKYQMNKTPDGNYYWITIKGLTPGTEYSFQYLVDNNIYIADPYAEKLLDPWNDPYIPAATYPNLKPYPADPNVSANKNGYVGIFQTCPPAYNWKVTKFAKPDKRNLVIYELLVRDFGDAKNYQMLIDTISYFKRLGINAIELMPVNEFSGNESWGYNPTFYCALDKAYGTKDKFKEFVDVCHQNGIAVILDVVFNHLDAYNTPQGRLYWDAALSRPAANSPWFNQSAPHPYSVFEDLNHTTAATQYLVKRSLEYWLNEYKIDGYRFDLAKGFTQKVTNETTVEDFDNARFTNLTRYYGYVIPKYPGTYMILEFLGQQRQEETLYAGTGFMLWAKCTDPYNEATMGYGAHSDFSKVMYNSTQSGFSTAAAIGYMESHDEERLMYKNLLYGNSSGAYNAKNLATALERNAAAAAVFFTTPGPKMIWQFGERGYDSSINANGGRLSNKPPMWHYMADPNRAKLYDAYSKLINLRLSFPSLFTSTSFSYDFYDNAGLFKRLQITDVTTTGLKINVVANLDVVPQTRTVTFQNTGNWYNYISNGTGSGLNGIAGSTVSVSNTSQSITLQPGEYHVYFYQPANVFVFNGSGNWNDASNWTFGQLPPASLPLGAEIFISPRMDGECVINNNQVVLPGAKITVAAGKKLKIPANLSVQNN
jgi:glycosidase